MKMNEQFLSQMREAAQLLQTEGPTAATALVQRALQDAGVGGGVSPSFDIPSFEAPSFGKSAFGKSPFAPGAETIIDINPADFMAKAARPSAGRPGFAGRMRFGGAARQPVEDVEVVDDASSKGKFLSASCTAPAGTRAYKLYVPSTYNGEAMPLVVMLHGCKQNPDDFAAGTGMNAIAEEQGCLVAYPAQAQKANGSNCWNWFNETDQHRDRGEPSIIVAITREIMRDYKVDANRVYVAGLSAGGAMAAILGTEYPELYAATGVHSGLPVGAAHDIPSAFAAMQNGAPAGTLKAPPAQRRAVPAIVFHGDGDKTVNLRNAQQVLAQCAAGSASGQQKPKVNVEKGTAPSGRSFTKTIQRDAAGKAVAEQWVVHGSGHAWSGGSRRGSYTDPKGPNASREMLRFFYDNAKNAQ